MAGRRLVGEGRSGLSTRDSRTSPGCRVAGRNSPACHASHRGRAGGKVLRFSIGIALLAAGCGSSSDPLHRALTFLANTQIRDDRADKRLRGTADLRGNWPQDFYFKRVPGYRVHDVSPFVVAFVHHALTLVNQGNQDLLGLSDDMVSTASEMRARAIDCMLKFESPEGTPDQGTFGFWPRISDYDSPDNPLESVLFEILQGPVLGGNRAPINLSYYPKEMAIPSDADVTATTYVALLDNESLDGGPAVNTDFAQFFADWRDIGAVPLRLTPDWLPPSSGVFLTWLSYHDPPDSALPNDVDLVVNANVVYALARAGRTDTPGFAESINLINDIVAQRLHRTRFSEISSYYPDSYVFEYCVSRAFREGPAPELAPSVEAFAQEIVSAAIQREDGAACWDKGDPALNTAFAVLTLLYAGSTTPLIESGVNFLVRLQNPLSGGWKESVFFLARADSGAEIYWSSEALTTAMALEAICRYRLSVAK